MQANLSTAWTPLVNAASVKLTYPRPQLIRGDVSSPDAQWYSLNGAWQWEKQTSDDAPIPFGTNLTQTILVPFPAESTLSGIDGRYVYHQIYRLVFEVRYHWPVLVIGIDQMLAAG